MSGHYPPLSCKDVKKILANLGFSFMHQRGSHEKWQKKTASSCWTVIVDCPVDDSLSGRHAPLLSAPHR
jgi:predicted RNA binding protein YcfA (HicA-like mRNA interferase family)